MFGLIMFLVVLGFVIQYWSYILAGIIFVVAMVLIIAFAGSRKRPVQYEELTENANYKIGAEVGSLFYYEVKDYCYKHHMTISDLIRKAVKTYMNSNK